MALQIVARRKVSLKGFAEGWDDAYIIVKAANETQRKEQVKRMQPLQDEMTAAFESGDQGRIASTAARLDNEAEAFAREFALQAILGGKVVSTNEDGTTELVDFGKDDVPTVIDALGFGWLSEVIEVATGADRLKAKTT